MANSAVRVLVALLLALASSFFVASAQDDAPPVGHRFGGGVIGGANFSQVDGDGYGGYNALGGIAGVWLSRQIGRSDWGFRVEIRYVGKGSRSVGLFGGKQGVRATNYSFTLHYLELPIYAEYVFLERFVANIGLSAGYLLGWSERNTYGDIDKATRLSPKRWELAGHIALAWHFQSRWAVRGGFAYSILPIRGAPDIPMGQKRGQYNNMLYLLLEYEI